MDPGRISFIKEDATQFMKNALSRNESWDIVILDPPKLAPRRKVKFHQFCATHDQLYTLLAYMHVSVFLY